MIHGPGEYMSLLPELLRVRTSWSGVLFLPCCSSFLF